MPADGALLEASAARWKQHMLRGDFSSAWRESDFIAGTGYQDPHRLWNGDPWAGKRVMLRCLHGLGDTIQFIRYAPVLKKTCRKLTVQSHPELVRLLERAPGVDRAVTWEQAEDDWEVQMEVTELPRIFRSELQTIPGPVPYLSVAAEWLHWADQILSEPHALKVGLVWRASSWDERRSIDARDLSSLLNVANCKFYILQKNADVIPPGCDLQRCIVDVADTAALMSRLDLIISVDTMTAHLAGALGLPTWLLLPVDADWRWMNERTDSPWYPTMKLFRQHTPGDWRTPLEVVATELKRKANEAGRA
jgi:hypothetical protein